MSVVDGATHTQKDDVESNGGSLENVAEIFVLFLCGVQLVLRSGVLTIILDLDEVDATPSLLRSLGRCCLGLVALLVAGSAAGVLPVSLNCPLPLRSSGSTHGSSLQFWNFSVYGENACVLEGRHGGLVGTKALGEENGPCLLYGYNYGFVFGFLCLLLQASGCCRRDFPQGLLF